MSGRSTTGWWNIRLWPGFESSRLHQGSPSFLPLKTFTRCLPTPARFGEQLLPGPAFQAYEYYVRYRPESSFPHVFISLYTRHPMSKYNVNNVCDQLSRRLQLSKKLTPHLLRHSSAPEGTTHRSHSSCAQCGALDRGEVGLLDSQPCCGH